MNKPNDTVYQKLATVLDTLPQGFPATKSGLELKLLRKVFEPDEAQLFCELSLTPETVQEISDRTGRSIKYLEEKLTSMWERGEIAGSDIGGVKTFKMVPWVVGIYELQLERMDEEFAALCEEYSMILGPQLLMVKPQLMQVLPIEKEIPVEQMALPFQQVSSIIDRSQSFGVRDCVCNKNKKLIGKGCHKPPGVCMAISSKVEAFENTPHVRSISRDEASEILIAAEEAALVHLTANMQEDQAYICNCCSCCCPVLGAVQKSNNAGILNSSYYAEIDPEYCDGCGICRDQRCQVSAILPGESQFQIIAQKCIGCALCIDTCPTNAISLVPKDPRRIPDTPQNEAAWLEQRGRRRGIDFSSHTHKKNKVILPILSIKEET